jgi:hypothetical protein
MHRLNTLPRDPSKLRCSDENMSVFLPESVLGFELPDLVMEKQKTSALADEEVP